MASGGGIDIKALNWVKTEIGEALDQIRQALETHVETPDPAKLDFIAGHLHQITGTLHIVELFGPALLAEEMEQLVQALKEEQVKQKQDAFEVLTRAILQLPAYLEHLSHGHQDQPVILLALLNDLRAARGLPLLSENALFAPDLNVFPPPKTAPTAPGEVTALAKKLRAVYQAALVGFIRGKDVPAQTRKLASVLAQLDAACHSAPVRQLWWVAQGVTEALMEQGLDTSVALKGLLGQLDRQLKMMVNKGEAALQKEPARELIKNLLFYVAQATSNGARVTELKRAFKLDELLPSADALSQAQEDLLGVNAGMMDHVAAALKEDLLSIKEAVDLFVRTKDRPLSELEPVVVKLRAVADTLGMLGQGRLRQPIAEQEIALKNVLDGTHPLDDNVIMGVAGALLFVESSLGDLHTAAPSSATEPTGLAADSALPDAEYRTLVSLTTQEARAVLARVKDIVLQFAAQPGAFELLQPAPGHINDIKGALLILGYETAADLLGAAGQFLSTELLEKRREISTQNLDTLADVITGFEYFLESAADDPVGARNGLNTVREGLALLGYGPADAREVGKSKPAVAAREPALPGMPAAEAVAVQAPHEPALAAAPPSAEPFDEAPPVDPEVLEIFLEEASEECQNVATQLVLWKQNAADDNALRTLRRSFHTVKGSGRIVGAMEIGDFAWAVESMLNRVLDRSIDVTPAVYGVVEQARDLMPLLVEELRIGRKGQVAIQPLIDLALRVAKGELRDALAASVLPEPVVESAEDIILEVQNTPAGRRHVDPVLAEIFMNETRTHLGEVSTFIEQCSTHDAACTVNEDLIRALHTLHGSARMANIDEIAEVADALEKWAKLLAENHTVAGAEVIAVLRASSDFVNGVLADLSDTHATQATQLALLGRIADAYQLAAEEQHQRLQNAVPVPPEVSRYAADASADEVDTELVNVFLLEAAELVNHSMAETRVWVEVPQRDDYIDELRRRFSTLHGGARIANLMPIAAVCSATNALLTQLLEQPALRSTEVVQLVLRVLEWLADALLRTREQRPLQTPSELLDRLEFCTSVSPLTVPEPEASFTDPDTELRGVFLDEAAEILLTLDEVMQRWHFSLNDPAAITELQRALHTIKGGANMARIAAMGDLCHQVETLLQRIGEGRLPANSAAFDLVQAAHDWMSRSIDQLRHGVNVEPADELTQQIEALMKAPAPAVIAEPKPMLVSSNDAAPAPRTDEGQVIPFPRAAVPVSAEAADSDSDLLDVFLEEANEIVAIMDSLISRWVTDTSNAEVVGELQRALHTIKGGARMAKIAPIGDLCHSIENIFEGIAQGRVKTNAALADLMHTAYDWLSSALERVRDKVALDSAAPLIEQIEAAVGLRTTVAEPVAEASAPSETSAGIAALMEVARMGATAEAVATDLPAQLQKAKASEEQVRVALGLLDELVNNAGEVSIYRSRIELQLNSVNFNLLELAQTVNRLREQLRKFEIEAEAQMLFRYEKSGVNDQEDFDPLELDRFSNMQQLSRSLVESVGDLGSIQKLLDNLTRESEILLLQQSRVASALQDGLMRTRLVPFSSVVPRLRRIVRQTSKELGKQIELHVLGAEGEMDRSVLNKLTPALEHMLRNAVDHGIEAPQTRSKAGKQDGGNITLKFWREGAEIVLSIADDGAGMDMAAIRKKALERGLMDKSSDLTDNEIIQFVLEAGFSTAKKVTQISGRGVGMDVVNNQIKLLNGTLQIASAKGQGTIFIVRLPLTVSVSQALMVHVGEQTYAIPLTVIDGVVRAGREELEKLQRDEHLRYEYGGHSYKFFHLGTVLNVSQPQLPDAGVKIPLILARAGDHRVVLHVEAIVARREVVIKSVGPQVATVIGISGATIMNDGGVALILDLASLIRAGIAHTKREHGSVPIAAKISSIMVVDDSITVRKVTERLLVRNGFETVTAKDGVDALAQLQEYVPDVMLLDIEMPRMDGYELATAMRNDDRLKNIPVIMITSRTGDKHRERAMAIGVNMYMGKPYQDKELLENINRLLQPRG